MRLLSTLDVHSLSTHSGRRLTTAFPAAIEPPLTKGLGCASGILRAKFDPATGEFRGIIQQPGKLSAKLKDGSFDRATFEDKTEDEKDEDEELPEPPPPPPLPPTEPGAHGVQMGAGFSFPSSSGVGALGAVLGVALSSCEGEQKRLTSSRAESERRTRRTQFFDHVGDTRTSTSKSGRRSYCASSSK